MFVPDSFALAMLMMVTSAICWGSWANTYKLTRGYRFELFYWDYAIGIVLMSLVLALTLGSSGAEADRFLADLGRADRSNIVFALAAGVIFNVGNVLLVAGIELAGLALAFPVAVGTAMVVGVVLSYVLQPTGNAALLALGVALAILAIVMDGRAYARLPGGGAAASRKGIGVCLASGLLMGLFAPLVTRALTAGTPLGPYSIAVCFTLGALACCFVFNVYLMKRPLVGAPVDGAAFFRARPADHLLGILGGAIWGLGTVFNFVAASFVGVAIAYAIGQAAPMVAALWGVLVWKEFRGADRTARVSLGVMFVSYVLAIAVLGMAYGR